MNAANVDSKMRIRKKKQKVEDYGKMNTKYQETTKFSISWRINKKVSFRFFAKKLLFLFSYFALYAFFFDSIFFSDFSSFL